MWGMINFIPERSSPLPSDHHQSKKIVYCKAVTESKYNLNVQIKGYMNTSEQQEETAINLLHLQTPHQTSVTGHQAISVLVLSVRTQLFIIDYIADKENDNGWSNECQVSHCCSLPVKKRLIFRTVVNIYSKQEQFFK